ncbi:restriction endonuclease subunit S [Synechocystis salina LEGE 06099]|uniref:restriction endonuclease subunit S n=1 Tax=Synechocystis salina TaxID=945780 RepID=UPI00187E9FF8|nr:restriction endonuclease subunit S [Synechocystis salina]MBE9202606.1 restriction endonuclease subunit S [Synechocystis salina LEGE 06099]
MVNLAFQLDYLIASPPDEIEKLSTTVKASEVFNAGVRLEASAFSIEVRNVVAVLENSGLKLISLYGENGLCKGGYYPHRFKRIYVESANGIPFLSSSEIISLCPTASHFVSRSYTPKIERLLPEKWDILISRSGTIGNIGLATEIFLGKALSEHVIRLQTDTPENAGYVAAFLRSQYGRCQLTQGTFGSVVAQIEPQHLKRVLIPDLPPIRKIAIGRLMCEAGELRDQANSLLDEADRLLHERLNLPYLKDITPTGNESYISKIKASQWQGRLEGSFHNSQAIIAEKQLHELNIEITNIGDPRVTKEVRAITKFRKRTYVKKGGIPLLSSKQLFQIDPIDVKKLAKGAHEKDLPEIQLEENMIAVTRSGTIGRVQIVPKYMNKWTASEHATRFISSENINAGYLYSWLASDYGYCLITRYSYGSVILEVDKEMFSSVSIPLPEKNIRDEIGNLVLKANQLRDQAWKKEQEAITKLENLINPKLTKIMDTKTNVQTIPLKNVEFDYNAEPIWELADRLSAEVPKEEWDKLPTDLASNFDHYQQ